ncbi:hypothetical protein [Falsiroseomonas sp. E2-1-a20]|uniref:hypothetical protein n=1 Tax=Falsiroseomonas sp. E2-1-a20 TaxID=3239300 RepID=UPI003F3A1C80
MSSAAQMLTVRVPLVIHKRGGRKMVLAPNGVPWASPHVPRINSTLVKAVARAFRWRRLLESGRYGTINEMAAAERMPESYICRLLRLTLLAPNIVEAILDGRQEEGLTLPRLMQPIPAVWADQRRACAT